MKAPKLKPNETAKSFKKRVAEWERVTGKKYPTTFSGKTNEERVLAGEAQNFGLNKPQNYYDREYQDQIREVERSNVKAPLTEDLEEDYLAKLARGEVDPLNEPAPVPSNQSDLTEQADSRLQENTNPWMPKASYNVAMQGGNTVFIGNDTDRVNAAEFQKVAYAADQRTKLSQTGGQEYVTDYQTAIQNSRRDGLSFGEAEQYYGEDVLDSAGQRVKKSNVFTLDEDGNPMGVKTRRQRLSEDLARAEAAIPKPDKTEDKKEDTSIEIKTEPNVGSEIKNTGEGGGVFTPPTPLSEEYKSLFNSTRA